MRFVSVLAMGLISLLAARSAPATTTDRFELAGGGYSASWLLPAAPMGSAGLGGNELVLHDIDFVEDGGKRTAAALNFYTAKEYGGFEFDDSSGEALDGLSFTGAQLFTGSWTSAVFRLGTFALTQDGCGNPEGGGDNWNCGATLTISGAGAGIGAAPEPTSLVLLGSGGVAAAARRRRRRRG